ncbi:MAG: HD domain-containing protein [Campylobacterota bacterium]|nr:HD domain-containing protein [Campylobacterota bacterium]
MSYKFKAFLLTFILFLSMNGAVYYVTKLNEQERINTTLESHIDKLKTHYEIVLEHQKVIANAIHKTTILQKEEVVKIFSEAWNGSDEKKNALREKLYSLLKTKYDIMRTKGVLQYHFVFPDNRVFLRMHKPSRYGDDLSLVRLDFKETNEKKEILRGLSPGKTAHAFRNIYPIYDKEKRYIGALDVAFPSEVLQDSLTSISKIHTHFIIDKSIFDFKSWTREDRELKYQPSAEDSKYFLTMTKEHDKKKCITILNDKLKLKKELIRKSILKDKEFSFYFMDENVAKVTSFLPIKHNVKKETIAWLVTYEQDDFIANTLDNTLYIRVASSLIFLLLSYFLYRVINQKETLNLEVDLKTKELQQFNENLEKRVQSEVDKNMQSQLSHSNEISAHLDKERYLRTIMSTVSDVNQYLITQNSLEDLLQITCERMAKQHYYEFCYIGLLENSTLSHNYFSQEGTFSQELMNQIEELSDDQFSKCPVKSSIDKNHEIIINDVTTYDIDESYRIWAKRSNFTSFVSFPLKKDSFSEALGVIVVFSSRKDGFEIEEISMLEELSGDIGFAINSFGQNEEIAKLHTIMMQNYEETILGFVKMIEQRDPYTAGHTTRVAKYSKLIAQEMRYDQEEIDKLYKASILHDIGKISTPDSILLKPSHLNSLEYELIKEHVSVGYEMLKSIEFYKDLADIMHFHHEHYDGTGYPLGLKGDAIPELSAIMSVADAFDAMTSTRIYKKCKSVEDALKELVELKGSQFHPKIVDVANVVLKNVEADFLIDQNPKTAIEIERLAYFYKDLQSGLYNENYLRVILNQKEYKDSYEEFIVLKIRKYANYQVLESILKVLSSKLLQRVDNIISFRYEKENIVLLLKKREELASLIESIKRENGLEGVEVEFSTQEIEIDTIDVKNLSELIKL